MLFNSIDFAIFLPIVFTAYWFLARKNLRFQNLLIVAASYLFYGWWDWRFLSLILFSTLVDYFVGLGLKSEEEPSRRKTLLWISVLVNIGFLGFFKYYNFFLDNFIAAFSFFGSEINPGSLDLILPVGISFYTFQTMSYTIDVYNRRMEPVNDVVAFAAFVSFFPQLVAGPIERATQLLPQFYERRVFDYNRAVDGMRQILWGFFKKLVIADNCAEYANLIFENSSEHSGSTLVIGALFFTFQIYGDFSGYSDIAIGVSRLFGFNLMQNFAFPYFSRDIAEFWRRWHISLSTWFRDYLYIPLGGSRGTVGLRIRNIFIIFIVSGFWHGANWTFIVWGALNALYFLPLMLADKNRENLGTVAEGKLFPAVKEMVGMAFTFMLTVFAWIFFRANDLGHAVDIVNSIFSESLFVLSTDWIYSYMIVVHVLLIVFMLVVEWMNRGNLHGLQKVPENNVLRKLFYLFILLIILFVGNYHARYEFIYFQF